MNLLDALLEGVGFVGDVLDTPGAWARNALAGKNPFQGTFDPEQRTSGRSLLEAWGMSPNEEGLDGGDIAGFGVEMLLDPLNWVGAGAAKKLLGLSRTAKAGAKSAQAQNLLVDIAKSKVADAAKVVDDVPRYNPKPAFPPDGSSFTTGRPVGSEPTQRVAQKMAESPRKAVTAAMSPKVQWSGIDAGEFEARVQALSNVSRRRLKKLSRDMEEGVETWRKFGDVSARENAEAIQYAADEALEIQKNRGRPMSLMKLGDVLPPEKGSRIPIAPSSVPVPTDEERLLAELGYKDLPYDWAGSKVGPLLKAMLGYNVGMLPERGG